MISSRDSIISMNPRVNLVVNARRLEPPISRMQDRRSHGLSGWLLIVRMRFIESRFKDSKYSRLTGL